MRTSRSFRNAHIWLFFSAAVFTLQTSCTEDNPGHQDASTSIDASQLDLSSDLVLSDAGDLSADLTDGQSGDLTGDAKSGDAKTGDLSSDAKSTDLGSGKWYQANKAYCPTFCKGKGKKSAAGPEGATCMSGEARSASGVKQGIKFPYGCWGGCGPMSTKHQTINTTSGYCFRKGFPQDYDASDRTVGCFCK